MDELEDAELVLVFVNANCEKESRVSAVDYFVVSKLHRKLRIISQIKRQGSVAV